MSAAVRQCGVSDTADVMRGVEDGEGAATEGKTKCDGKDG